MRHFDSAQATTPNVGIYPHILPPHVRASQAWLLYRNLTCAAHACPHGVCDAMPVHRQAIHACLTLAASAPMPTSDRPRRNAGTHASRVGARCNTSVTVSILAQKHEDFSRFPLNQLRFSACSMPGGIAPCTALLPAVSDALQHTCRYAAGTVSAHPPSFCKRSATSGLSMTYPCMDALAPQLQCTRLDWLGLPSHVGY